MNSLFIVGNGFDLHHDLPTSFAHFSEYVKKRNAELHGRIEEFLPVTEGWADLEAAFGALDVSYLVDSQSGYLVSYGAENWSDSYHHDFQYEIAEVIQSISAELLALFAEWLRTIDLTRATNQITLPHSRSRKFLSFNYTQTLEQVYGVLPSEILYIHGNCQDDNSAIILGHGWSPSPSEVSGEFGPEEEQDTRLLEALSDINSYFSSTFKPTERIIEENKSFFAQIGPVDAVYVLGHSLAEVDHLYFKQVFSSIVGSYKVVATYYSDSERAFHKEVLGTLTVADVELVKMSSFR